MARERKDLWAALLYSVKTGAIVVVAAGIGSLCINLV
jgi:hypothetical protein